MQPKHLIIFLFLKFYLPEAQASTSPSCHEFYYKPILNVAETQNATELILQFESLSIIAEKSLNFFQIRKNVNDFPLNGSLVEEVNSLFNEAYLLKDNIIKFLEIHTEKSTSAPMSLVSKLKVINKIYLPEIIQKLIELQVKYPQLDFKTLTLHTQAMQEKKSSLFFRNFETQPLTSHGQLLLKKLQQEGKNLTKEKIQEILLEQDSFGNRTSFVKKISFADFKLLLDEVFYKQIDLEKIITGSDSKNNVLEVIEKNYQRNLVAFYFREARLSHFSHTINFSKPFKDFDDVNRDFKNLSFLINITDFNLLDSTNKEVLLMTSYFKELLDKKFKGFFGVLFNSSTKTTRDIYNQVLEGLNRFITSSENGLSVDKRAYIQSLKTQSSPFFFETSLGKVKVLANSHLLNKYGDFYEK